MNKRDALRKSYERGTTMAGWQCWTCKARFEHHGKHRRTFIHVSAHTICRHRRLPMVRTDWTARAVTFTWTSQP